MEPTTLYDYQKEMKQRIDTAFGSHRSVMVQMPTGTGKTHLLASVVRDTVRQGRDGTVWIVAHRRELVVQAERTAAMFGLPVSHSYPESCRVRVYSIQWLSRHLTEMQEPPALVVIDEAHHALARTYSSVVNAFPKTRILGLTATPCRLNGKGFADLFEILLHAGTAGEFIKDGYLSPFDYVSVPSDCEEIRRIDGMTRRAADGDYCIAEMREVLDTRPSVERLYRTVRDFANGRKGIVYAIDIGHAEHIAGYYRDNGLEAECISSRTPGAERDRYVKDFAEGRLQVLVNVDIFSEGFDCPDVEFIQMARPTLSLAKFLQQAGRGLRVSEGKGYCTFLDNVGLYRLFGLPSDGRDWQAMFEGREKGIGMPATGRTAFMRIAEKECRMAQTDDTHTGMVVLARHDNLKERTELQGLLDKAGAGADTGNVTVLPHGWLVPGAYIRKGEPVRIYRDMGVRSFGRELVQDTEEYYYSLKRGTGELVPIGGRMPWTAYVDSFIRLNPNVRGRRRDGLAARHSEYIGQARLLGNDGVHIFQGRYYLAKGTRSLLDNVYLNISRAEDGIRSFIDGKGMHGIMDQDGDYYLLWDKAFIDMKGNGIAYVKDKKGDARGRWINLYTMQEFGVQPEHVTFGFVDMLRIDDIYFVQKARMMAGIPLKKEDFAYNDDVFQILDYYVILKNTPQKVMLLDKCYGGAERKYKLMDIQSHGSHDTNSYISQTQLPKATDRW